MDVILLKLPAVPKLEYVIALTESQYQLPLIS